MARSRIALNFGGRRPDERSPPLSQRTGAAMSSSCGALLGAGLTLVGVTSGASLAIAKLATPPRPPASADATNQTCSGFTMGAAAMAEWQDMGGADGRLGCPTANEVA